GAGGQGTPGDPGTDGLNGVNGGTGTDAHDTDTFSGGDENPSCTSANEADGGAGGVRVCPAGGVDVSGGDGGKAECPVYSEAPGGVNAGQVGKGPSAGSGGTAG